MKERVEVLVRQFRDARKHRLRFEAAVTALSVLVTGNVFWQLRRVGTALSEEVSPRGAPIVETDADPPDLTADAIETAEDSADWEVSLPEFTDETPQQRIAAVAASQIGYTEGTGEVLLSDDGLSRSGYTRYGAWYGNPYGEWNTMFTYFCMYYAGIRKADIPYGSGCWAWYETLSENGMLTPCGREQTGDIIFFDTDADGDPDRTGIVSGIEQRDDGMYLRMIEGNCDGAVAEKSYLRGGSDMIGVLSADSFVTEILAEPKVMLIDYSAESESGIQVDVQAEEGVFPEGTVMEVTDISEEDALQAAADALGDYLEIHSAVAVDITFYNEAGEEIEPADGQSVSVQISLPEELQFESENYSVLHLTQEGEAKFITAEEVSEDGASFVADSFSIFMQIGGNWVEIGTSQNTNGYGSSPDNPYILTVGDSLQLVGKSNVQEENYYLYCNDESVFQRDGGWIYNQREDDGLFVTVANFRALAPGEATVSVENHTENGNYDLFYVRVIDIPPIMVYSSHGYKDSNQIREYLGIYDGSTHGLDFPYDIFNIYGDPHDDDYVFNTQARPYLMIVNPDEPLKFYAESPNPNQYFTWNNDLGGITQKQVKTPAETGNGMYRYEMEFSPTQIGMVEFKFSERGQSFWVRVWRHNQQGDEQGNGGSSQIMNHADMEIADGGTYSISSTHVDDNGNVFVDVKIYTAHVTKVNGGYLFDADGHSVIHDRAGNTVECYTSEPDPNHMLYQAKLLRDANGDPILDANERVIMVDAYGNPLPYDSNGNQITTRKNNQGDIIEFLTVPDYDHPIGDYEQFGVPGHGQYEMTSAWIHNLTEKNGTKVYDAADVKSAKFDVNLHLTPQKRYSYQVLDDGSMVLVDEVENWQAEHETRDHIVFNMDYQDVVDARNKCPYNNGLDFSARTEFTVLEMPVQKKMLNGNIPEEGFEFEVIDLNNTPLISTIAREIENEDGEKTTEQIAATATCGTDGKALLQDMRFIEAGEFYFKVQEKNGNLATITYDDTEIYFKVKVVKKTSPDGDYLIAHPVFLKDNPNHDPTTMEEDTELKSIEFTNYEGFELPDTGGTGTLPYMGGGVILISAAFILPLVRRRKEDECDS